jgi:hypothetical protein
MSYSDLFRSNLRLALLNVLQQSPGYSANGSILQGGLYDVGLVVGRDEIETELAWLAAQGYVNVEEVRKPPKTIVVARLTERGEDVQAGRVTVPGVKRPHPV